MKYFYLLLFIVLPSIVLAQSNYHEGYILKTNGDTVKGFVNYREWERSPKTIDFKPNINDAKATAYDAIAIKGFGIYGEERYVAYLGRVTTAKTDFPDLPTGIDTTKRLDTLFLRQVATGKYVTLYANKDEVKSRIFVAGPGATPTELIYYSYYNEDNKIVSTSQYKGQLFFYVSKADPNYKRLFDEVNDVTYNYADLEKAVDHINGVKYSNSVNSRFFFGAAANITTSEEDLANYNDYVPKKSKTVAPKISFGMDFFNNPQVQQLIFRVEVSATYANPRYSYDSPSYNLLYEYNQFIASITPQILVNLYNKDNFKIYIDGGWAFNFATYSNNKSIGQYSEQTQGNTNTVNAPYKLEPYYSNFPLQAGVVVNKKWEFFATYTPNAAYTKYNDVYASNQSLNFGVKWLMGNK
jgi:hypothetical protein